MNVRWLVSKPLKLLHFRALGRAPHDPGMLPHDRELAREQPCPKISALLKWAPNAIFGARKACMMVIHTRNDHGLYLHLLECNNNWFLLLLYCVIKC